MKQFLRSFLTLLMLVVWASGFAQDTETIDLTKQGFENATVVSEVTGTDVKLSFAKGSNTNTPTYYTADKTVRLYVNNTLTISSTTKKIAQIEFTLAPDKKAIEPDTKSFSTGSYSASTHTWTGNTNKIILTQKTSSKQFRIQKLVITFVKEGPSKTATTLTFPKTVISINGGDEASFKGQSAKLCAGEQELTGKTIKYAHTGDDIFATFDGTTGAATLKSGVYGTETVTATYEGDDTYANAVASYTVKIIDPNAIVPLVFDKADDVFGTLEDYNKYKKDMSEYALIGSDGNSYTFKTTGGKTAAKNGNLLLQKTTGSLESPIFKNFENGYTVNITFSQGGTTPLTITSGEDSKEADITSNVGDNTNGIGFLLSMNIKAGNTFTLNAGNAAYISKIEIVAIPGITLDENADDTNTKIEKNNGKTVDVKLTRSLKAGLWNTICLPFNVTAEQVESVLKATGYVKEFDKEDEVSATIFFKPATEMKAGVPYLIKPTADALMLEFKGVTINNVDELNRINGNRYCICGVFGKTKLRTTGTDLFLNAAGKFVAPAPGKETMKGFRAYFNVPSNTSAAALNINIDGETTGINNIETETAVNGKVYNLNGQYVGNSLNGLKKGIYVVNGKKVIK
jgi:hypothetical protein